MAEPATRALYFVTEDWYFWSHRLPLARAARDAGYDVVIATRTGGHGEAIRSEGFRLVEVPFERSLRYPLRDLAALGAMIRCLWHERPAVVHRVSLKPILFGAVASLFAPRGTAVNAMTGLGYLFASADRRAGVVQRVVVFALRWLLRREGEWLVLQNDDDLALTQTAGIGVSGRRLVIRGSGVDLDEYAATPIDFDAAPIVVLPARMLEDKGVREFVGAATQLRRTHPRVRFALVGPVDRDNPAAITQARLDRWVARGDVEWWGQRDDMPAVYRAARIVCLPSYREGLPKVLLEAAASGRPLVATDVPGCRDVCLDGQTGRLVAPRDAGALARAISALLDDDAACAAFGAAGRRLVEERFSTARVCAETLALYRRALGTAAPAI